MKTLKTGRKWVACLLMLGGVGGMNAQNEWIEPPVMGWSSWNTYRVNIDEALIRKQADAMVELGLKESGYRYVNIDDGFFGYRDEKGRLHTHPQRFPNGLKGVAAYIHSLGLQAGIYSEAGANTCGSIWDADKHGIGVGLYGFERQDADLFFNEWGFDFIKIDYCGAGQQLELDEQERYTEIVRAIREVCPRNISLNICRWAYPGTWVRNLARSWRISPDIAPNWAAVKRCIDMNLYLSAYAGGYVLVKDIEQKRGKVRAVALYNPSDSVCSFRVPLEILELAGKTRVRDLVKRKDEGRVTGSFQYDVPAHGVKILRVEGEERLEPVRYEAEQAYLHQFDNLAKRPRGVAYLPYEGASGGMLVTNLGGHRDNYARWNEVFSEEGGRYRMTVCYVPAAKREREINDRRLEVTVNGTRVSLTELETDRSKGVCRAELTVDLQKGYNTVSIGSRLTWTPDLDCFVLEKL